MFNTHAFYLNVFYFSVNEQMSQLMFHLKRPETSITLFLYITLSHFIILHYDSTEYNFSFRNALPFKCLV